MNTAEPVYYEDFADEEEFFHVCRVANSMPLIAKVTDVNGIPMLDGGMADAIPVKKALEEGWNKLVIVLTRNISYRKKPQGALYMAVMKLVYRKYPKAFLEG